MNESDTRTLSQGGLKMTTLKEIALRRTRELPRPLQLRVPKELAREIYDSRHGEQRYAIKHPITGSLLFGNRLSTPAPLFADLVDQLPIDLTRMELIWTRSNSVGYFSSEQLLFKDPLMRFVTRTNIPGVYVKRVSIIAVKRESVVHLIHLSDGETTLYTMSPTHVLVIDLRRNMESITRRIDALICYPVRRVRKSFPL